MDGEERRKELLGILSKIEIPVPGHELAKKLRVSRQIIVQDIALLRVQDHNILSTNKGYMIYKSNHHEHRCERVFYVNHTQGQVLDEFYTIIDLGGRVLNLFIEHELYGQIQVDLIINNRVDAKEFVDKLDCCTAKPLNTLTDGWHYHTVEAASERLLDLIEDELRKRNYLL
jgi:transcriptional regulator of NAD metabolism